MKTKPVNAIDLTFRALSDWNRVRIMSLLLGGELCVCELVSLLELPQPAISKHLAYLRKIKLVVGRKAGQWNYYRLASNQSAFQQKLVELLEAAQPLAAQLASDRKRLAKSRKSCCV